MAHNRRLVLGGSAFTEIRGNRHTIPVLVELQDELERVVDSTGLLAGAPFRWIGLFLRFGLRDADVPLYQRIDKKDGELPLTIELNAQTLSRAPRDEFRALCKSAVLKALVHVADRYSLAGGDTFSSMLSGQLKAGHEPNEPPLLDDKV